MTASPYALLLLAGIAVSVAFWVRLARRDERLLIIYVAALVSAFLGAKLVYLAAEGWLFWDAPERWLIWATGKSILGALLGGYLGVELAKRALGYRAPTGDFFALVAPVGIILGRVGCLLHGCCLGTVCAPHWWTLRDVRGVPRWPAVPVELGFNVLALAIFLGLHRRDPAAQGQKYDSSAPLSASLASPRLRGVWSLRGQHFHLYLIGYGLFRFAHEFFRATPRLSHGLSGYQLAALAVAVLGGVGFWRRAQSRRVLAEA